MSFRDLALPLAAKGIPVIRLAPRSKVPLDQNWPLLATTDTNKILAWDAETPNAGCGAVAKSDGFLFFESDADGTIDRYEKETGEVLDETFVVQSRPGRLHYYFAQTGESRACGSITQQEILFGSLRQHNAFVVGPGSIHCDTGFPYEIVNEAPIIPIPSALITWLQKQKKKAEATAPSLTGKDPIPYGVHDTTLTAIGGKLRADGLEREDRSCFDASLLERCVGVGPDGPRMWPRFP